MGSSYNERTVGYQELWILGGKMQRLKTRNGYRYVVRLEFVMKLLRDRPDTVDIRVRITDSTADKRDPNSVPPGELTGYEGNWIRSDNVLEQLCEVNRSGSVCRSAMNVAIQLLVAPGVDLIDPDDPESPELYWKDGPSIPIYGTSAQPSDPPLPAECFNDWHLYTLQHSWLALDGLCNMGAWIPSEEALEVGQIKMRVCIDHECIHAIRVYAEGPDPEDEEGTAIYKILPGPGDEDICCTNIEAYRVSCAEPLPDRCLDDGFIVWDISELPCGEYTIYAEAYDEGLYHLKNNGWDQGVPDLTCYLTVLQVAQSQPIQLGMVEKADLVRIADIYEGDLYWTPAAPYSYSGYRPRNNHDWESIPTEQNRTVDCSNYLTQLLRRLARADHWDAAHGSATGNYPIKHSDARHWNNSRRAEVTELADNAWSLMEKGDLVTRDPGTGSTRHHVMIWVRLIRYGLPSNYDGPHPPLIEYWEYTYEVWESTTDQSSISEEVRGRVMLNHRRGDNRTHFRQWIDDVVFTDCN